LSRQNLSVRMRRDVEAHVSPAVLSQKPVRQAQDGVSGCPYATRCDLTHPSCRRMLPELRDRGEGHQLRCPPAERRATSK
jgi:ABC-type dipeptide/oligopeptide/nickel transport system ATPase component